MSGCQVTALHRYAMLPQVHKVKHKLVKNDAYNSSALKTQGTFHKRCSMTM